MAVGPAGILPAAPDQRQADTGNTTCGCLAPQHQRALDHWRLRAVEIVWNSYVLQLCVVTYLSCGCYDARCPCRPAATSAILTIFVSRRLRKSEDIELIFVT